MAQPESPAQGLEGRQARLRNDAIASWRAMDGWETVRTEEDWVTLSEQAREDYLSGRFLIERMGAERHLDPKLMATLWGLRQQLLREYGNDAPAAMLADFAIIAYYHALRVNGWIGNFAMLIEHEFFLLPSPTAKFKKHYGGLPGVEGVSIEDAAHRVGEELMPLLDRANRMVLRNLRMLRELRHAPAAAVAIGQAGQVNIAQQQVNAAAGKA